jgi:hypothetical protein
MLFEWAAMAATAVVIGLLVEGTIRSGEGEGGRGSPPPLDWAGRRG